MRRTQSFNLGNCSCLHWLCCIPSAQLVARYFYVREPRTHRGEYVIVLLSKSFETHQYLVHTYRFIYFTLQGNPQMSTELTSSGTQDKQRLLKSGKESAPAGLITTSYCLISQPSQSLLSHGQYFDPHTAPKNLAHDSTTHSSPLFGTPASADVN
jgi:hypothetical protein